MPCISVSLGPLPDLSILLPSLSFSTPSFQLGVQLCCQLETPPIPALNVSIGSLPIPGLAAILLPLTTAIMLAMDTLNTLLAQLPASCPLE